MCHRRGFWFGSQCHELYEPNQKNKKRDLIFKAYSETEFSISKAGDSEGRQERWAGRENKAAGSEFISGRVMFSNAVKIEVCRFLHFVTLFIGNCEQ
jgi:hypothetical protein